ncbi:APC family permease [Aeoliella straminimaris]|nr:APC family permease [Aeoliella straminimaris]
MSDSEQGKLSFQATWAMAVGGMVGGGIFSTLGVVIEVAGPLAWLSFVVAGLVALVSGYSYVKLAESYGEGGGAFTFLREVHANSMAGATSWVLIVGYVLTNAVYAFTFGEYLGHVFDFGPWMPRVAALAILGVFIVLNLRGAGEAGGVEIFLVWFKLAVLLGLATFGLMQWDVAALSRGTDGGSYTSALFGAATIFMAYEGFQLLAYDYDDIRDPNRTLPRATLSAIVVVIAVYVAVALGVAMLIGADKIIAEKEVSLSIAGEQAFGMTGLVIVTIAAAFSTGSAINSTLFATARLAHLVAQNQELPAVLDHRNRANVPDRAVIGLGLASAVLATFGTLSSLVEAASLAFLVTFAVVNGLACYRGAGVRLLTGLGCVAASITAGALVVRLYFNNVASLVCFAIVVLVAWFVRPWLLKHVQTESPSQEK